MSETIIVFENNKDAFFRKSTDFALGDVKIDKEVKFSGSLERLSVTILKGVQDQVFSLARQANIEKEAKKHFELLSNQYMEEYIAFQKKELKKTRKSLTSDEIESEAKKLYDIKKKTIDKLAEKEAWRIGIDKEITDDDLVYYFDSKSIFEYSKYKKTRKETLYEDIKKVQLRFNNWRENRFKDGEIIQEEYNLVLFPTSIYSPGSKPYIKISVNRQLLHCILFLNKDYLRYHLDSYLRVETPNATRLYELLVGRYASDNYSYQNRKLDFAYLQKIFQTNYKNFYHFLDRLINPSLEKINSELGTDISWQPDEKSGKAVITIKFIVSDDDKRILLGEMLEQSVDESVIYSFEYYLTLLSLGGNKSTNIMKNYNDIKQQISNGSFSFFNRDKMSLITEHIQNISASEELENILRSDSVLAKRFTFEPVYLNAYDNKEASFIGVSAIDSLEYLKTTYFNSLNIIKSISTEDECFEYLKIVPFKMRLTNTKSIVIDNNNFEAMHSTIESLASEVERFLFDSEEKKTYFMKYFGLLDNSIVDEAIIVADHENDDYFFETVDDNQSYESTSSRHDLLNTLEELFILIHNDNIIKQKAKWEAAISAVADEHGDVIIGVVSRFFNSRCKDALYWTKKIPTAAKFTSHFEEIKQSAGVYSLSLFERYRNSPDISQMIENMKLSNFSDEEIRTSVESHLIQKGKQ